MSAPVTAVVRVDTQGAVTRLGWVTFGKKPSHEDNRRVFDDPDGRSQGSVLGRSNQDIGLHCCVDGLAPKKLRRSSRFCDVSISVRLV